ncbi:MAG: hypothetical protein S4CHLAM6_11370 [Chlamydiae bacterium]|nr:hypothetical protein [Chlamydiota bacterium]
MHSCEITLENGKKLKAVFNPQVGMNLMSYSLGSVEVMDQNTMPAFKERMAGMGALIGPHFHHRKDKDIPSLSIDDLFSFIPSLVKKGQKEPFSHGIARYVPWKYEGGKDFINAKLSGKDTYKGYKISELEGQDFELSFKAKLKPNGLFIDYSISAQNPSVIGLHYYYRLDNKLGNVSSQVDSKYHHPQGWRPIPNDWFESSRVLNFELRPDVEADFGFRPVNEAQHSQVQLKTSSHQVKIYYQSNSKENSWQLYHPKDATYVCLEPVSSANPREASEASSNLKIQIEIIE